MADPSMVSSASAPEAPARTREPQDRRRTSSGRIFCRRLRPRHRSRQRRGTSRAVRSPGRSPWSGKPAVSMSSLGHFMGISAEDTERAAARGVRRGDDHAAPDTMIFRDTPAHRFVDTAEDHLSTFALDVDTGSYTLTRGYLDRGLLPPPAAIRVEEFVNAQSYDDPAPRRGDFALVAEGAPAASIPANAPACCASRSRRARSTPATAKPAVLTFVVDVSGSMNRENRLGLVKRALGLLLDELRPDDRVGLVVYGSSGRVLLRHTRDLEEIRRAISELRPEGSTNVEEGLRLAYDLADEGWRQGASNRILLCSDGVANVGATGPESILARIGNEAQRGIALTTIGFGMGNYNDALMEQLADQGDGTYHYVDALRRSAQGLRREPDRDARNRGEGGQGPGRFRFPNRLELAPPRLREPRLSPTATSATTASTPASSAPATRRRRSMRSACATASRIATGSRPCACAGRASRRSRSSRSRGSCASATSTAAGRGPRSICGRRPSPAPSPRS